MSKNFAFLHSLLKRKVSSIGLQGLSSNGFLSPAQDCCSSFTHSLIHSFAIAQTGSVNKNSSPANSHRASNIKWQEYEHPAEKQRQTVHWCFSFLLSVQLILLYNQCKKIGYTGNKPQYIKSPYRLVAEGLISVIIIIHKMLLNQILKVNAALFQEIKDSRLVRQRRKDWAFDQSLCDLKP